MSWIADLGRDRIVMKKVLNKIRRRGLAAVVAVMLACLSLTACGNGGVTYGIGIHMPGGDENATRFSDEEIMAKSNTIKISAEPGSPDAGITLVGVDGADSTEAQYISSGTTVEFNVRKGCWYKIRIQSSGKGTGEYDYVVTLDNVDLRISEKVN